MLNFFDFVHIVDQFWGMFLFSFMLVTSLSFLSLFPLFKFVVAEKLLPIVADQSIGLYISFQQSELIFLNINESVSVRSQLNEWKDLTQTTDNWFFLCNWGLLTSSFL